jgi:hypothetical protein
VRFGSDRASRSDSTQYSQKRCRFAVIRGSSSAASGACDSREIGLTVQGLAATCGPGCRRTHRCPNCGLNETAIEKEIVPTMGPAARCRFSPRRDGQAFPKIGPVRAFVDEGHEGLTMCPSYEPHESHSSRNGRCPATPARGVSRSPRRRVKMAAAAKTTGVIAALRDRG